MMHKLNIYKYKSGTVYFDPNKWASLKTSIE